MKQVDIFKQKIFTGDKKQMLFFWKAIKNMNKYISVFLIFFLNACISPSGYLSSDNSTSYYFDATNGSDDNNGTSPDKAWKNLAKSLEKTNKKGTNVFVMPVNKAFAKTNEDRRKIEVT